MRVLLISIIQFYYSLWHAQTHQWSWTPSHSWVIESNNIGVNKCGQWKQYDQSAVHTYNS
jgi:hypothetical protein